MATPDIKGLEIIGLIGEGACGSIYLARPADGNPADRWLAVRTFNSLAVNLPLIEGMMGILKGSSYPDGLIPISWKKSEQDQLCMIMPLLADIADTSASTEPADTPLERKRRQIIARCLELNPDDRYPDLNEVLHAWHNIETETETEVREVQSELRQQKKSSKLAIGIAATIAAAGLIGCGVLVMMLDQEKADHANAVDTLNTELADRVATEEQATAQAQSSEAVAKTAQETAEVREKKHRKQLISLGVANDHLLAWMMRDHSKDLPELQKSGNARDTLVAELQQFLKLTEDNDQFQPVRARIMMQLAELEIYNQNPSEADQLLDAAVAAWTEAKLEEPSHAYRIARARLACLMLALDQKKNALAKQLLPKARQAAQSNSSHDTLENQRLKAVMLIIDGRMIESSDPAKALTYFQQAITAMKGLRRTLTENVIVRSDLSRYTLEAATLADSLNRVEDADRLRGEAASYLEKLLKKAPHLELPKVQLAKIHIMAANAAIREGDDSTGKTQLAQAEQLLSKLGTSDTSPEGASMQMAAAKGLRAVLLRDAGKTAEAQQKLKEAIELTETIVEAQKDNTSIANEPLYRLAVLHWQLAGLTGDRGDSAAELRQGKKAAALMEDLLQKDAGQHDNAIRRGLGYLYGDLGHTAASQGNKKEAAGYFKNAATIWQSLITQYGKEEEYTDGLKWSQTRQREMSDTK